MKRSFIIILSYLLWGQSEDVTLTVYKDGTALIKQPVAWVIPAGKSFVTWESLPKGIHKDTPFLNLDGATVISQKFNDNIFSAAGYYKRLLGKNVDIDPKKGKQMSGKLLEINSNTVTIQHKTGILTFNRNEIEHLGSQDFIEDPNLSPFLSWDLESSQSSEVSGELVYKSSNFLWNTIYRLKMTDESKGELIAEAVVSNMSDISFYNANLKLVEGHLNKIRKPRPERFYRTNMAASRVEPEPAMDKGTLGDYHIYSINEAHDLESNESITLRMYGPLDIDYKKTYVFENTERRQKEEPLEVRLEINNKEANGLGIVLPDGNVEMYSYSSSGGLEYIGADKMGQVPKGQSTTLSSGRAFDVIGKRWVRTYDRQRKSEEAVIEIQVTNQRAEPANIQLIEHIHGDWIIKDESLGYKKKDASTIQFSLILNGGETKNVYYTYRKEWK